MKRTVLMKIDVETLYPFIRKKSPRHIDPKIPSHGPPPHFSVPGFSSSAKVSTPKKSGMKSDLKRIHQLQMAPFIPCAPKFCSILLNPCKKAIEKMLDN